VSVVKNLTQALKNTNKEQSNIKDILQNILKTMEHLPDKTLVQSALTSKKFDSSSPAFWVCKNFTFKNDNKNKTN
jgi:hypothetical protein